MPNNLKEALIMDLNAYPLRGKDELKVYLRRLIGEAYLRIEGNTNTNKYVRSKNSKSIEDEIRNLTYKGEIILSFDMLANEATDAILNNYLESKNNINSNNNKIIMTFDDVMIKTLTYYKDKYNDSDLEQTINMARLILNNYFIKNHIQVFSSTNGTRDYVLNAGGDKIKEEILNAIGFGFNDITSLINNYSNYIANIYMSKNNDLNKNDNIETIINKIVGEIKILNLNDRQKEYLISEFNSGNVSILEGYISSDLINEYVKYSNTSNFSK